MWGPDTASWSSLQNVVGAYMFSTVYCTLVPSYHFHHLRLPWWAPYWGLVGLLQGHSEHFGPWWVSYIIHHGRYEWTMFLFTISTWWATLEVKTLENSRKANVFYFHISLWRWHIFIIGFVGFSSSRLCKALVSCCIFISMIWIYSIQQLHFCCCYWVIDYRNLTLTLSLEHYHFYIFNVPNFTFVFS